MAKENQKRLTGTVLDIQRLSTEDGPGLRTTVFLKGCSLHCSWCHNPESIYSGKEIQWSETGCIRCNLCIDLCEFKALSNFENKIIIDRSLCTQCGRCTNECPSMAMESVGALWRVEPLVSELVKDNAFFETSGGGVTLSGGEMTLQADFCREVLKQLNSQKIHTAIDTCGQCSRTALEKVLPYADLILFDLKEMDHEKHKAFTGASNESILENLTWTAGQLAAHQSMWVRTPVIPGATMTETNIREMGSFISRHLGKKVSRWELCTFNNLCKDKYHRLGQTWTYENELLIRQEEIEALAEAAKQSGVDPERVHWSGSTR